jgi:hypothetical protein
VYCVLCAILSCVDGRDASAPELAASLPPRRGLNQEGRIVTDMTRWAVAGTGGIARRTMPDLRLTENVDVVAVSSRSQANADSFAAEHGVVADVAPAFLDSTDVRAAATFSDMHIDETVGISLTSLGLAVASIAGGFDFGAKEPSASRVQIMGSSGSTEMSDDIVKPSRVQIATPDGVDARESDAAESALAGEIKEASRGVCARQACFELVTPESPVKVVVASLDRAQASANSAAGGAL